MDKNKDTLILEDDIKASSLKFKCPNCGTISQDQVLFLCNTCGQEEMIQKEGIYICPGCLNEGDNFECSKCGTTKVTFASSKDAKIENLPDVEEEQKDEI